MPKPMMDPADLVGQQVCVHLNLTTKRWVLAERPKSKVLAYADFVTLADVTFRISEKQRQYCIDHNGRWVHAWALGRLVDVEERSLEGLLQVTYNPFRAPTFHVTGMEWPVHRADLIVFANEHGYMADPRMERT